jgi:hypothetical protein
MSINDTNDLPDPRLFCDVQRPSGPSQDGAEQPDDTYTDRISVLLKGLGTGIAGCELNDTQLVLDFGTWIGFQRFLRILFRGEHESIEAIRAYETIFSAWDVDLLPYVREFDPLFGESATTLGCVAADADAVVTARVPASILPWVVARLQEIVLDGTERLRCFSTSDPNHDERRRRVATQCARFYSVLVDPHTDSEATASQIEQVLFDRGWTDSEVVNLIVAVARSIKRSPEAWGPELPSFDAVLEVYHFLACDMCECSVCERVRVVPAELVPGAAAFVLAELESAYNAVAGAPALEQITRLLTRGWTAEQLVHAITAYFATPRFPPILMEHFFGAAFDVFCPGEDFLSEETDYNRTCRGVPWFPESVDGAVYHTSGDGGPA